LNVDNEANHIKWLLTDLILDLTTAVELARELVNITQGAITNRTVGAFRIYNHSIVLSLFKLVEIRKEYNQFLRHFPSEITKALFEDSKAIEQKNICKFRSKYAAHIFDNVTNKPVSIQRGMELLQSITGRDNVDCLRFYEWVCPEEWSVEKKCIITTIVALRDYCRGMPGGELERP
jgi:hypothetical protein